MDIKRFALAAADEIDEASCFDEIVPSEIIERHMQAAVDKATLGLSAIIASLRDRISSFAGLGPLIEEYAGERMKQAEAEAIDEWGDRKMFENRAGRVKAKITATLTGGAP